MSTTMVFFSSMSWMVFSMALSHSWPVALDDQGHTMSSRCRPPRTVHGATYKDSRSGGLRPGPSFSVGAAAASEMSAALAVLRFMICVMEGMWALGSGHLGGAADGAVDRRLVHALLGMVMNEDFDDDGMENPVSPEGARGAEPTAKSRVVAETVSDFIFFSVMEVLSSVFSASVSLEIF